MKDRKDEENSYKFAVFKRFNDCVYFCRRLNFSFAVILSVV